MKKINPRNFLLTALSSIFISACSGPSTSTKIDKLSLGNGLFEIYTVPGSMATDNCGIDSIEFGTTEITCVSFPVSSIHEDGKNWDAEYIKVLDENGWKWVSGAADINSFEKPKSKDCNYRLTMMRWFQASEEDIYDYYETGEFGKIKNQTYIFLIEDDLNCGDERRTVE